MVEFRFDIRPLFAQPIVKVSSNLLPHTFRGDRRQALDATSKMSEIIDRLGQLSATSQKLTKPVTTAQRLRMSDNQILYLLADVEAGHNGAVIGLLKVGAKDLYLFDETGQTRKVDNTPCILDFYIHESRQRAGLGKDMFETMLAEEHWTPLKCSVDRPSEKLLGFLKKHYGLERIIPQANNFVLYEGFFGCAEDGGAAQNKHQTNGGMHITNSPNTQLFGAHYLGDEAHKRRIRQQDAPNIAAQITQISPVGRYGARRPTCSMAEAQTESAFKLKTSADGGAGESPSQAQLQQAQLQQAQAQSRQQNQLKEPNIIHSNSTPNKGGAESSNTNSPQFINDAAVDEISEEFQNLQATELESQHDIETQNAGAHEFDSNEADIDVNQPIEEITSPHKDSMSPPSIAGSSNAAAAAGENFMNMKKPASFQLSKQHTGMKNISFGVGSAVTPTNKMEFNQESPEDFGVVKINRHVGKLHSPPPPDNADAMSTVSSGEGLTDQGYNDLKFFHNKLW